MNMNQDLQTIKEKISTSMTRAEVAEYLNVSLATVSKLWDSKKLESFNLGGQRKSTIEMIKKYLQKQMGDLNGI